MRILGVDLGSASVKAVEIDSAFGRMEIHEYHEEPVEAAAPVSAEEPRDAAEKAGTEDGAEAAADAVGSTDAKLAAQAAALARLLSRLPRRPDRVAVAMPTRLTTFRTLRLPTRDKKAIQASLGFELEDELPFELENAAYDYSTLATQGGSAGASTELHVSATLRTSVARMLEALQEEGIDPDLITSEAWSYRTLLNRLVPAQTQEEPIVLVDIGAERTLMHLHSRSRPLAIREYAWGGDDITRALAARFQSDLSEAESLKKLEGFILPPSIYETASAEQREFSDVLLQPVSELLLNLKQFLLAARTLTRGSVGRIYLTGGGSIFQGLGKLIEEELNVNVFPLQPLTALAPAGVRYPEHADAIFALAVAAPLSLIGPEKSLAIQFRKGDFTKRSGASGVNFADFKGPFLAGTAVAASLLLSLTIEQRVYSKRLEETNAQLDRSIRSFFGSISSSGVQTYLARPSELRTAVAREIAKQRELNRLLGPNPQSPVAFWRQLSTTIGPDVVVDLIDLNVGAKPTDPYDARATSEARLDFVVANPQVAEKLAASVGASVANAKRSRMEQTPPDSQGPQGWKISFSGKPVFPSSAKEGGQ